MTNSNDEMVNIVDDNGETLYQSTKKNAHTKGLLHPTILAEVIDTHGNWLLVKQSSHRQDAGQYVSPVGGHIMATETDVAALKREADEELGLTDFGFTYVGKAVFKRNILGRIENHLFVLYEIYSDQVPVLNHESESYRKFSIPDLNAEMKNFPERFGDAWFFAIGKFYRHLFR